MCYLGGQKKDGAALHCASASARVPHEIVPRTRAPHGTLTISWGALCGVLLGAAGRTRTDTDCSTSPSSWRVYQFHHSRIQKIAGPSNAVTAAASVPSEDCCPY